MSPIFLVPVGLIAFLLGAKVMRIAMYDPSASTNAGIMFSFVGLPLILTGIAVVGGAFCLAMR